MSVLEWKNLKFFRLLSDVDHGKVKQCIKSQITSCTSNATCKIFSDSSGFVHIFFRSWESISFSASDSAVLFSCLVIDCNSLITFSKMEGTREGVVKCWDLNKLTKRLGAPCTGTAVIPLRTVATAMNASNACGYICIAVGFESGELSLFRGSISREFSTVFRTYQISTRRITGIEFKQVNLKYWNMYICSDAGIFCYLLTENNDIRETQIILDSRVEPTSCCAMTIKQKDDTYFIVGRHDAVYCYTSDGRGPCYAIEGTKKSIARLENYIIVIVENKESFTTKKKDLLIIIDTTLKIIVLNKPMNSICRILYENKNFFVLNKNNEVYVIFERDLHTKMKLLLQKNLFDIALKLTETENCDEKMVAQVFKLYGDHLYNKGDFAGAMEKYIKTIGVLEPYCVIRKFIDSKLVCFLSKYMEFILKMDTTTEEHIKLLINCKSRITLPSKLNEFLCNVDKDEHTIKDIYCTIGETMTSNKIIRHSSEFCNHEIFDTYLTKFMSILNDIPELRKFLCMFPEDKIYSFFKEHSQILMRTYPLQTTEVLKSICDRNSSIDHKLAINRPELFLPLFADQPSYCMDFLEHIIIVVPNCNQIVFHYLFELYLRSWKLKNINSGKLIAFLDCHHKFYNQNHIFILCKLYSFWDGILHFYRNKKLFNLSIDLYVQNGDVENLYSCLKLSNTKLCIQSLKKLDFSRESTIPMITFILNESLKDKKSSLQIFQSISNNKKFQLLHVKEFYSQELLKLTSVSQDDLKVVQGLEEGLHQQKLLLRNFSQKAIEVRCNICELCRHHINHPAVYFLCQHYFHQHCLSLNLESNRQCVVCNQKYDGREKTSKNKKITQISTPSMDFFELFKDSLSKDIFNKPMLLNKNKIPTISYTSQIFTQNTEVPFSSNPFEVESDDTISTYNHHYDANLNPFEE